MFSAFALAGLMASTPPSRAGEPAVDLAGGVQLLARERADGLELRVEQVEGWLKEMKLELVGEPVRAKFVPDRDDLARCRELGAALAALQRDLTRLAGQLAGLLGLADDADAMAGPLNFRQNVGGEEHGLSPASFLQDQVVEGLLHEGVKASRGLVKEQELGLVQQALDDAHLLPVPV